MIGSLNPWEARKLYMALIDPHLTHGCEIAVDTTENKKLLATLESKQKAFIRRILGIHARSPIVPLFSETAIIPLQYRRVLIALNYLRHLITLPDSRYAKCALNDSIQLFRSHKPCWIYDLLHSLQNLPSPVIVRNVFNLCEDDIDDIVDRVSSSMQQHILDAINTNAGLYLLRDRLESSNDPNGTKQLQVAAMRFRHYLSVPSFKHRAALTKLLTAIHELAVERAKWLNLKDSSGRSTTIPRDHRLCRFCLCSVETPEHALLECTAAPELVATRLAFWTKLRLSAPLIPPAPQDFRSLTDGLIEIIALLPTINLVVNSRTRSRRFINRLPCLFPISNIRIQ